MPTIKVDTTTQHYDSGAMPEADILLFHTTEGMGWPGYNGGGTAPHDTVRAIRGVGIEVRHHTSYDEYARALENDAGGVETNRRGVIQVELRGTCDPKYRDDPDWYFWPDADDAVLEALADYYRPIMARYGIPARAMAEFVAYPASYGDHAAQRLTASEWLNGSGICGHEHVPENAHGDPGKFPIARFIAFLEGEDDMATPQEVWRADIIPAPDPSTTNPTWQPDSYLREIFRQARSAAADAKAARADIAALAAKVAAAPPPGGTTTLTDEQLERVLRAVLGSLNDPPA